MPRATRICCGLVAALALSGLAFAQDGDRCLVGTWEPQGNAMADWLRRQNPQMAVQFQQEAARLVFDADGRYRADFRGQASAQRGDGIGARMGGQFGGDGAWRSVDGRLILAQASDRSRADLEVKGPGGASSRMRLPRGPGGPQTLGYRCEGDHFETRMQMPGAGETVVQPYRRKRG